MTVSIFQASNERITTMSIKTIDRIADVPAGSSSLPDLAARIRHYHAATADSLRCSVENAMHAGDALLEAKAAVPHGRWLPWLAEHCKLSERSVVSQFDCGRASAATRF
jgi:hypothetical protein